MKAQILAAHVTVLGLTIVMVLVAAAVLNAMRSASQEEIAIEQAGQVCSQLKIASAALSKADLISAPSVSRIRLSLPRQVGGLPYTISGNGSTAQIAFGSRAISCALPMQSGIQVSGAIAGGATELALSYASGSGNAVLRPLTGK